MIELSGVSKAFGRTTALQSIDVVVAPEKTTVLIGPSGCGKSTVLRLMIGLIRPDNGTVRLQGAEVTPEVVLAVRQRMGYVIQEGGLFPHLTARQNITLMARHLTWDAGRIELRLEELSELTQFPTASLQRFPVQLSGGQRQRVSLMRALMLDPDVLLLDEPLGSLDPMMRSEMQAELKNIFRQLGKTVVMVTHDMAEAAFFGDCIVLMRAGAIIQQGTLHDLINAPGDPFVTNFINAQRMPLEALGGAAP